MARNMPRLTGPLGAFLQRRYRVQLLTGAGSRARSPWGVSKTRLMRRAADTGPIVVDRASVPEANGRRVLNY